MFGRNSGRRAFDGIPLHDYLEHLKTRPGHIAVREAADLIDVNRYTLLDWVRDGKFPATKIGNAIKIDRHDLAEFRRPHSRNSV